jgi:hypothetical protein
LQFTAYLSTMSTRFITGNSILAVPLDRPERLFSGNGSTLKKDWLALAALWHPDRNASEPDAGKVLQHINALYQAALHKFALGEWEGGGVLELPARGGGKRELCYLQRRRFELGERIIGETFAAYTVEMAYRELYDAALRTIGTFRYADDAMKKEFSRALPRCGETVETADRLILIEERNPDLAALDDLIEFLGGRLEAKHAAWIVSGLLNLTCYLEWAGLMHGAIAPDTVFVSPRHHSVALLGGWWYAVPAGAKLRALPQRTLNAVPSIIGGAKRAASAVDSELVRQVAREMLGDPGGTKLLHDESVPRPFRQWIAHPPAEPAYADYCTWEKAREASFGARKFAGVPAEAGDIYC